MQTVVAVAVLTLLAPLTTRAQDIREERVRFQKGTSSATRAGRLEGGEIVDYVLRASAGQRLTVDFTSSNTAGYFNLLPGDGPVAIHIGSTAGNHYQGTLPSDGDYRIRVYLMRSAARRNETTNYSFAVRVDDADAAQPEVRDSDFADSLSGGPDWWRVAGVPAGDVLNVRAEAGTAAAVVGALANGDAARNLGCKMVQTSRWCRIEAGADQKFTGWVNGRYLVEGAAPE